MFVEQSNEEWRQWIKLTEKKESISSTSLRDSAIDLLLTQVVKLNEDIEYYKKRIEVLEEENYQLCGRVFNQSHEMRVRRWTTEEAMPAENFPTYKVSFDE